MLLVTSSQPGKTITLLTELATQLPIGDLTAALRHVDQEGGGAPEEMLRLVTKLLDIQHNSSSEVPELKAMLQNWGVPPEATSADTPVLRGALSELFQRRGQTEFNPDDYKVQLDASAQASSLPVSLISSTRYAEAINPDEIRARSGQIAAQILARDDGDDYRPTLLAFLDRATDLLLEGGKLKTVFDAANAAQTHAGHETDSQATRKAARDFWTI